MKPFEFNAGEAAEHQTVVLLHSSASSSRQWSALVELLSPGYDVRTVDFHGHGMRSVWHGARPLSLADEAALVEPILHDAGPVHLVGHSYGGAVALKIAQMHPRRVRSLVVYEPVLFRWLVNDDPDSAATGEVIAVADDMRKSLHYRSYRGAASRFVDYWFGAGAWDAMSDARQQAIAARIGSVMAQFDAVFGADLGIDSLQPVQQRTLCLTGERTVASTRRIGSILRDGLPSADHQLLAGMGHMGPITHALEVNQRIERFLRGFAEVRPAARTASERAW